MIIEVDGLSLKCVQTVCQTEYNDVLVCVDENKKPSAYYTVWRIKNRDIAKKLLLAGINAESFACDNELYFVFPYEKERPLERFYWSTIYGEYCSSETIWENVIVSLMTCKQPYSIIYLMLTQGQIMLGLDGQITLGYMLNLTEYDANMNESDCANECALIFTRLDKRDKRKEKVGKELLAIRLEKNGYKDFMELYKDIKVVRQKAKERTKLQKLGLGSGWRDKTLKLLSVVCVFLAIAVAVIFISNILLGDTAFFRIFSHSFETIGTESLLQ